MAKITILCPPLMGHITPLHQLALNLKKRGHQISIVHFFDQYPFENEFDIFPIQNEFQTIIHKYKIPYNRVNDLREPFLQFFKSVYDQTFTVCKNIETDLFVIDHFFQVGEIIAKKLKVDYIFTYSTPDPFISESNEVSKISAINVLIRKKGFEAFSDKAKELLGEPLEVFPFSSKGNICFTTESIIQNEAKRKSHNLIISPCNRDVYPISYVGPALLQKAVSEDDKQFKKEILSFEGIVIFISFGTVWSKLLRLEDLEEKLIQLIQNSILSFNTETTMFIYTGTQELLSKAVESLTLRARIISKDFLNQSYLLDGFDLAIFHGGYNSFVECVSNEVPMLCVPMGWDQGNIAKVIVEKKIGDRVNLVHHTIEEIREKGLRLINNKDVMSNLMQLASDFNLQNGAKLASYEIESLLATKMDNTIKA